MGPGPYGQGPYGPGPFGQGLYGQGPYGPGSIWGPGPGPFLWEERIFRKCIPPIAKVIKLGIWGVFMKTTNMRDVRTIVFQAVSRRDLCAEAQW